MRMRRKGEVGMAATDRLLDLLHLGPKTAVVVHDPSNMFYLTEGYSGEGLVYISAERRVIVTDFRYTEQAERQAPGFEVMMTDKDRKATQIVAELVHTAGITEVRAETNYLSVDRYEALRAAVGEEVSFVPLNQAPQKLRQVKTPAEVVADRKSVV